MAIVNVRQVGLVGFGRIAESAHMPAWRSLPNVEIAAVADTCPVRRAAVAAILPAARVYTSADELLDRESLDVIDICTPPHDHAPSILKACARGVRRIVCEKPLTVSRAEFRAISAARSASNCQVFTINTWLRSDLHRLVTHILAEGTIGQIRHVTLRTLRPDCALGVPSWQPRWRTMPRYAGGGIVLDHGWHQLYLMANWIGAMPVWVAAQTGTALPVHLPVEDHAHIHLTFPDATGRIELSWAAGGRTNDGEIIGADGTILIEDDGLLVRTKSGEQTLRYGERLSDSSYHPEWFTALFSQILADDSHDEATRNLDEAEMLLGVLLHAYGDTGAERTATDFAPASA